MSETLRIVLAQLNFLVGDIQGNADKIIQAIHLARDTHQAQLIVFPELALSGYPPEDLLYRPELYQRIQQVLPSIQAAAKGIDVLLGYPEQIGSNCFNQAAFIHNSQLVGHYHKQLLPNYSVFDEIRYFKPGNRVGIVTVHDLPIGITICEDLWSPEAISQAKAAGAKLIVSLNASPFAMDKAAQRQQILSERARETQLPIIYVNCVGGQDELVFDGGSMVLNADGKTAMQADFFQEGLYPADFQVGDTITAIPQPPIPSLTEEERIYKALVFGVREYIEKNHFPRAVLGLSGGIDSALTLAIAVDAIGKDRVEAVMMPSHFTSELSLTEAKAQAHLLGVKYKLINIEPIFNAFQQSLQEEFAGLAPDLTEENLQARCRGTLLMAISNKKHAIVLATGNKSEMAVGYSTLYGDMVGGFCVLKDVPKTWVYRLAAYRNQQSHVIPQRVIDRPPTAELSENQFDQNFLPAYEILDDIIERYIERDESVAEIIKAGFDPDVVQLVTRLIDKNEYKRRQAAPGVRITEHAFGKDRRYPITSGFSIWNH